VKRAQSIMVVDDDRSVRQMTADVLRHAGYDVLVAASGADALTALRKHEGDVDLLLTDVQMQRMDGGELAEAVLAEHPQTKVLFMSGYTGGAALHDNVRDDGPDFIAKPFVSEQLLKKVKKLLKSEAEG
jgi:CheY-like chemotaxis protein